MVAGMSRIATYVDIPNLDHLMRALADSFYLKQVFSMLFLHNRQGVSENSNCTNLVGAD